MKTKITLLASFFASKECVLLETDEFRVVTFLFDSGVEGIRLENNRGSLVMLPFQGQQIWSAVFDQRNLTMKSMFDQPRKTQAYLETYGGFLLHCGAMAMGVPTAADNHPLHGELPNAPYQEAFIEIGSDDRGEYIGLGGSYNHTVAFSCNYLAQPLVKLYKDSSLILVRLSVKNLKFSPMDFMYLAHVNFRPVVDGKLVYSAKVSPETVRVRRSIPSHVSPKPGYREFLEELARNPEKHHHLTPGLLFDPEVVFMIDYLSDNDGWAHSLQLLPDGSADYVAHRPAELDHGIRWICRTVDQEALGLVLPATAEPEGFAAEKEKGNIKTIEPQGDFHCEMVIGSLSRSEANRMVEKINNIIS